MWTGPEYLGCNYAGKFNILYCVSVLVLFFFYSLFIDTERLLKYINCPFLNVSNE